MIYYIDYIIQLFILFKDKLSNMFRLADLYFEERDIDKEFRKIFLQSFHPIKKRKITQKIEGMDHRKTLQRSIFVDWRFFDNDLGDSMKR